jgi:hypothetical protein
LIFTKLEWLNPGLELLTSWYALSKEEAGNTIELQAGVIGLNIILMQKWLPKHTMAFTIRAGGALAFQLGDLNYIDPTKGLKLSIMDRLAPQINLEPSFLWMFWKQLYVEIGVSGTLFLNTSSNSGAVRPWIGFGWLF